MKREFVKYSSILLLMAGLLTFAGCCKADGDENGGEQPNVNLNEFQPLIYTVPYFVAPDSAEDVRVVVNVEGYGIEEGEVLYAHTGVLTTDSTDNGDWKYVKHDWGVNEVDCCLAHEGGTIYSLVIKGGPRAFYNVGTEDVLTAMTFVFRNANATKVVKAYGGIADFVLPLYAADATAAQILAPSAGSMVYVGEPCQFLVVAQNIPEGYQIYSVEYNFAEEDQEPTFAHIASLNNGVNKFEYTFDAPKSLSICCGGEASQYFALCRSGITVIERPNSENQ